MQKGLPDADWTAFQIGLKPTLRMKMEPARAERMQTQLREQGIAAVTSHSPLRFGTQAPQTVVYVARSVAQAEALRAAEARTLAGIEHVEAHRQVGALLGYPACCVEAFVERLAHEVPHAHEDWAAARAALAATRTNPSYKLNTLLWPARTLLVSFYPCRYDCDRALGYATRLLVALARRAPAETAQLALALAVRVIIAPDGARAILRGDERVAVGKAPLSPSDPSQLVTVSFASPDGN